MKGSLRQRSPVSWELGRDALGLRRRKYLTGCGANAQAQRKLWELLTPLDKGLGIPTEKVRLGDWQVCNQTGLPKPPKTERCPMSRNY